MSSTCPVSSSNVTRSPMRTGCVIASRIPAMALASVCRAAKPMTRPSTAEEASRPVATLDTSGIWAAAMPAPMTKMSAKTSRLIKRMRVWVEIGVRHGVLGYPRAGARNRAGTRIRGVPGSPQGRAVHPRRGAPRGDLRRALVRSCERRRGRGERREVRRAGAHARDRRPVARPARPLGLRLVPPRGRLGLRRLRATGSVLPALPVARACRGNAAGGLERGAPGRRVPGVARCLSGCAGGPLPAHGARAGAAARAAGAAAPRAVPRGALLRRSLLGEPLPAAGGRRLLRSPHGPLGMGRRMRGARVREPLRGPPAADPARADLVELAPEARRRRGLAPPRPARHRGLRRLARHRGGRRIPLPRRAGRLVARARRAARRRVGRPRRGRGRRAPARLGLAHARLLRVGGGRPVPDRGDQPDAVRDARVRARCLRGSLPAAAARLWHVGRRLARAAPLVPGRAPAADVAAALRGGAVPDLHVAGGGVPRATFHRPRGGRVRRGPRPLHGPIRELALDRVTRIRAVLLDALGTLVELQPPAPRLARLLRESGFGVSEEQSGAGFMAEIAYYLHHHLEGSDPERLERLRDRCAEEMRRALDVPGLDHATARRAMLGALEFRPYPDVLPALGELRERGVTLVIASNWDCSLPDWLAPTGGIELVSRG